MLIQVDNKQEKKLVKWLLSGAYKDKDRPVLQCVHKRKDGKLETSNGHILFQCRLPAFDQLDAGLYHLTIRGNMVEAAKQEAGIFPDTDSIVSGEKTNVHLSLFNADYLCAAASGFDYVKIETNKYCMFFTQHSMDDKSDPYERIAVVMRMRAKNE